MGRQFAFAEPRHAIEFVQRVQSRRDEPGIFESGILELSWRRRGVSAVMAAEFGGGASAEILRFAQDDK